LRLGRNGHFGALRSHGALELLTNCLSLGTSVANLLIGDGIGAILTEELTGVISEHVRISQDRLISFVLIREFLKEADSFHQLVVGGDQRILKLTSVVVEDGRNIRTEMVNYFKTCLAYPVGAELLGADFQRSLGKAVGVSLVAAGPRHRGRHPRVAVLGNLLGSVIGLVGLLRQR